MTPLLQTAPERSGAPNQRLAVGVSEGIPLGVSTSSVPTTVSVPGSTTGTIASDSVLANAVR